MNGLTGQRAGLAAHYCYRQPGEDDRAAGQFHGEGLLSREALQSLLCLDDYDFYLCGPPPFMQAIYAILRGLGVAKERIAYEFFGPATVLEPVSTPGPNPLPAVATASGAITVEFQNLASSPRGMMPRTRCWPLPRIKA